MSIYVVIFPASHEQKTEYTSSCISRDIAMDVGMY